MPWLQGWVWGIALFAVTGVFHVCSVVLLAAGLQRAWSRGFQGSAFRHPLAMPAALLALVSLVLATLHGIEAMLWAGAYVWLGALRSAAQAVPYSIEMLATHGAQGLRLAPDWAMMGALEAADGMLLFGLSTAFMFAVIQDIMLIVSRFESPKRPKERIGGAWE